jgi:hypothetical protein
VRGGGIVRSEWISRSLSRYRKDFPSRCLLFSLLRGREGRTGGAVYFQQPYGTKLRCSNRVQYRVNLARTTSQAQKRRSQFNQWTTGNSAWALGLSVCLSLCNNVSEARDEGPLCFCCNARAPLRLRVYLRVSAWCAAWA